MREVIKIHKAYLSDSTFAASLSLGLILLVGSLFINYGAGTYATARESNAVSDVFLDSLPIVHVDIVYVYGALAFWLFVMAIVFRTPQRIPFVLKNIALFIIIRSMFISLTHIAPSPDRAAIVSNYFLNKVTFGGDLFFSGHTGLPFLMALVFWNSKPLRYTFLVSSVVFGTSALLGHLHYSIDVFAAFFITYSIYAIARWIFPYDAEMFEQGLPRDDRSEFYGATKSHR